MGWNSYPPCASHSACYFCSGFSFSIAASGCNIGDGTAATWGHSAECPTETFLSFAFQYPRTILTSSRWLHRIFILTDNVQAKLFKSVQYVILRFPTCCAFDQQLGQSLNSNSVDSKKTEACDYSLWCICISSLGCSAFIRTITPTPTLQYFWSYSRCC